MQERIISALKQGAMVITATRRLARSLRQDYNTLQQEQGLKAWESPKILTWSDWMADLWQELMYAEENPQTLLSGWQELILWERVIRDSPESRELLQVHSTASVAQEAWRLASEWRLDLAEVESLGNEDARAFVAWSKRFCAMCDSKKWLEQARIADVIKNAIARLRMAPSIILIGFDEFSPQQQDFLSKCSQAGCSITTINFEVSEDNASVVRVSFPDPEQEIEAAARWARALMENGFSGRIGVVFAELASRRNLVEHIFRRILEPTALFPGEGQSSKLINLSAGNALAAYPLIQSALAILSLSSSDNEWDDISNLMRSSYLVGADTEHTSRALLDARIRQNSGSRILISNLLQLCHQNTPSCPMLAQALGSWLQTCTQSAQAQTAGQWSRTFSAMLEAFGWPGERPLNSVEFQTMQAWTELLSSFASTDLTGGSIAHGEAVSLVRRIASQIMFQPETENVHVQILGMLEASGLFFDHLWIAGLHDEAWPGPANPNPFLPIRLQREKGIPRCSPERELEFSSLITKRLLASGNNVILSYPVRIEDRELATSPLIASIPSIAPGELNLWSGASAMEIIQNSRLVEKIIDEKGPPLGETAWQRGGTKVFQYQSGCPFRAFIELRLGAEDLESPVPGLDPRQRGTLVHAVLEEVWKQLKTHAVLCSSGDLFQIIRHSVDTGLTRFEQSRGVALPGRFAALERERLQRLITNWLEIEKNRQPFEVVQPEGEKFAEISGIRCRVKIDRVDRLSDGREVIIDYKTGDTSPRSWETDRPDEPQLPLYSTIHEKPLAGVLFARIKTGDLRFLGLLNNDLTLPNCESVDLAAKICDWSTVLERIGSDFRVGHAEVDPKNPAKQCRFCGLACLCRISETNVTLGEEEAVL
ncbi:MAG: PD-(D/E)XK nuclease family protein [Acidobacteria bacterium]|nr:PD-(D/E)XK nuclease family protein [Acidobacteriota bacterium]